MLNVTAKIRFKAKLLQPAAPKAADWSFLVLPIEASAKLPTRSMVTVDGALAGHAFQATLEPDGQGSHWLKVGKALSDAAGLPRATRLRWRWCPSRWSQSPMCPWT